MSTDFGKRLKFARERASLTQDELAVLVKMAQSTLAAAESKGHGSRKAVQLAAACSVNAHWLATGDGEMLGDGATLRTPARPQPLDLAAALADAVAVMPATRWRSIRAQLDDLAGHPEMRDDVLPELRALLNTPITKRQVAA